MLNYIKVHKRGRILPLDRQHIDESAFFRRSAVSRLYILLYTTGLMMDQKVVGSSPVSHSHAPCRQSASARTGKVAGSSMLVSAHLHQQLFNKSILGLHACTALAMSKCRQIQRYERRLENIWHRFHMYILLVISFHMQTPQTSKEKVAAALKLWRRAKALGRALRMF